MRAPLLAVVVALALVAGCLGGGGNDVVVAEADPARVEESALEDAGFDRERATAVGLNVTVEGSVTGDVELEGERDVEATLRVAEYRASSDPPTPTFLVVASPAVRPIENVDETVDPARAVSLPELLATVQDQYADVRDVSQADEGSVTLLGNETALETYEATATVDGESVPVRVRVASVSDGDDYVTAVGIVPSERSDAEPVRRLAGGVTHER